MMCNVEASLTSLLAILFVNVFESAILFPTYAGGILMKIISDEGPTLKEHRLFKHMLIVAISTLV